MKRFTSSWCAAATVALLVAGSGLSAQESATLTRAQWLKKVGASVSSDAVLRETMTSLAPADKAEFAQRVIKAATRLPVLQEAMGLVSGDWTRDYRYLSQAVERHLGSLGLGFFAQEAAARELSRRGDAAAWARAVDEELPELTWLENLLKPTGMPLTPEEISVPRQDVRDAFVGSRDIRDKYLVSTLIWDLGRMDEFAERLLHP